MNFFYTLDTKGTEDKNSISSKDFLQWAVEDMQNTSNRAIGNATGNIKRAIHCRIDEIIKKTYLNDSKDWKNKNKNTHDKLEIIKSLGIKFNSIVSLLTKIRNKFEHDYKLVKIDEIEAFLETTELWLNNSYKQFEFNPIALVLRPHSEKIEDIINIEFFEEQPENIKKVEILQKCDFDYFWLPKKEIHEFKKGKFSILKFEDMDNKALLKCQKNFIIENMQSSNKNTMSQKNLTKIYQELRKFNMKK